MRLIHCDPALWWVTWNTVAGPVAGPNHRASSPRPAPGALQRNAADSSAAFRRPNTRPSSRSPPSIAVPPSSAVRAGRPRKLGPAPGGLPVEVALVAGGDEDRAVEPLEGGGDLLGEVVLPVAGDALALVAGHVLLARL